MFDLAIKSKFVVTPDGVREAIVLIEGGVIADVVATLQEEAGDRLVDAGNSVLLPGLIDPHVHINEPGRTEWEGFETGTKSAIAGGLTTLVDMPLNSTPVTTSVAAFKAKLTAARKQLHTNCGFWGGIVPANAGEIEGLAEAGVLGFKAFLSHSGIEDFPNVTEEDLRLAMPLVAKCGLPLLVHCEVADAGHPYVTDNPKSYKDYLASRPPSWEDRAIALMIRLCEEFNCHVHIVHLSSAGSVAQVREAKQKGLPLTVETAPHYLYFSAETIPDGQTQFKCAPPIRERANNQVLWEALRDGIIDFVATDHSPAPPAFKHLETGDFTQAWGGIASLQFTLPIMWTEAVRCQAGFNELSNWLSRGPASLIGQQAVKGQIARSFDADLLVFNPDEKFTVTESLIQHRHKITPYLNHELHGVVEQTYLKGVKVFDKGEFTALHQGRVVFRSVDK